MTDDATRNLPSRDFEMTSQLYAAPGFSESSRDKGWMILEAGGSELGVLSSSVTSSCYRLIFDIAART
jgi:hypothetical protein